ncbi:MAG: DUF1294 domain-containing protein [Clostridia bacterium]|nr:DUF1294 domain-containing protein [Clostridia bacterium]
MTITLSTLLLVIGGMSFVLFAMMGIDKALAKRGAWRVPERTLFLLALLGGALGGIIGMYFFRHKTRHASFKAGLPVLLIINIACCIALITE